MTFREVEKLLVSNGWYHTHTNESHYIYKNKEKEGSIVVPRHKDDIPKWINSKAESLKINFSKTLEEALLKKIYNR